MTELKTDEVVVHETTDAPAELVESKTRTAPPLPEGEHFIWGTGRRKSSVARVRIRPGDGQFVINKRTKDEYFLHEKDRQIILAPLATAGLLKAYDVFVNVQGGGYTGQAGAVQLGLARAISKHLPEVEHDLRAKGLLTRDARMVERKKPGQPGARKRFQFSKR
jgi:small subunit ribosomal protein S9